jgi:hypothetical protein
MLLKEPCKTITLKLIFLYFHKSNLNYWLKTICVDFIQDTQINPLI